MSKYLKKFIQSVPAIQGKQIISVLNDMRVTGSISTAQEYRDKLREMTQILAGKPMPISKLFFAEKGDTIDSESFNFMMDRFADDIDTLLNEMQVISDTADLHRSLIGDKVIKNIELAINSLEKDIKKYEILNRTDLGFSVVQYDDFSNKDDLRFSRSEGDLVSDLFYERSAKTVLPAKYDGAVDVLKKSLSLPYRSVDTHTITNVDLIYNTSADVNYFNVDFPEFDVNAISDNTTDTYWVTTIMGDGVITDGATVELTMTLDGLRPVSYIELDPILYNDFYISKLYYIDRNDEQQQVFGESDAVLVDQQKKITFEEVQARKIIVEVLQKSYVYTSYYVSDSSTLYDTQVRSGTIDMAALASVIRDDQVANPVNQLLNITGTTESEQVIGYAYTIGLDNIRVGTSEYRDIGIYASKPLVVDAPILLSLETIELYNYIGDHTDFPKSSIEFSVYKKNYDESGALIDTEVFNVMPSWTDTIKREYMVVNQDTMQSSLRFQVEAGVVSIFADASVAPLTEGLDYDIDADRLVTFYHDPEGTGAVFYPFSTYTVSYEPKREVYLNNAATVFMDSNNMVEFTVARPAFPVASSEIYLTILMRRNSIEINESPYLNEYKMLVAIQDDTRFTSGI